MRHHARPLRADRTGPATPTVPSSRAIGLDLATPAGALEHATSSSSRGVRGRSGVRPVSATTSREASASTDGRADRSAIPERRHVVVRHPPAETPGYSGDRGGLVFEHRLDREDPSREVALVRTPPPNAHPRLASERDQHAVPGARGPSGAAVRKLGLIGRTGSATWTYAGVIRHGR